jgi:predicted nucleic acid-binding protein
MEKLLIDTDVLIDYLRNVSQAVKFLENKIETDTCYLSAITIAELFAGVREGKERSMIEKFFEAFEIVEVDTNIAQKGGLYRRDYGKSYGTGLADAIIAASAEFYQAKLITLNKKHFPMVKKILVPYKKI